MKTVNVGVIGAGYWGPNIIRNFYEIPETELKIVCDVKEERRDYIQGRFPGIKTTANYRDLLDGDVDAIAIATPVSTHHHLAMECLRAGKHVLIEKPMAKSSLESLEMVRLARAMGKTLMVGHTFLYNPAVQAMKDLIDSGEIGTIYYINSTRVNLGLYQPDVNVVWDLAPHDVSMLMYILNLEPVAASARGGMYVKPGVHDVAYMTLLFPGCVMADLRVSWLDPCKIRSLTVVGSKKMLVYDDIEPVDKLKIYDKGVDVQPYTDTYESFHMAYRYGDTTIYPLNWHEPLRAECLHFVQCIESGEEARSGGMEGLKVIQVLEAAQRSLLNGGTREEVECQSTEISSELLPM